MIILWKYSILRLKLRLELQLDGDGELLDVLCRKYFIKTVSNEYQAGGGKLDSLKEKTEVRDMKYKVVSSL